MLAIFFLAFESLFVNLYRSKVTLEVKHRQFVFYSTFVCVISFSRKVHLPGKRILMLKTEKLSGVSIKFEVGSWVEKNNRLYEHGAVRNLSLIT